MVFCTVSSTPQHKLCTISQRNSELMNALNAVRMTFKTKRSKHWSSWCYSMSEKVFDFFMFIQKLNDIGNKL